MNSSVKAMDDEVIPVGYPSAKRCSSSAIITKEDELHTLVPLLPPQATKSLTNMATILDDGDERDSNLASLNMESNNKLTSGRRKSSVFDILRQLTHGESQGSSNILSVEHGRRMSILRTKGGLLRGRKPTIEEFEDKPAELVCSFKESPFYVYKVCAQGLINVVDELIAENPKRVSEPDPKGLTCLHHAAGRGKLEVIKFLLEKKADINAKDIDGNTPLHTAVDRGQIESVQLLLAYGADGNILNGRSLAPVHLAAISNKTKVLEVLVSFPSSIDVNMKGETGRRAIHYAAKFDHDEIVQILLNGGSRLCDPCDNGLYPIHVAAVKSSVNSLEVMLKFGETHGYTQECMLSCVDKEANSPLHLAVNSGNYEVVRICLEHGAKIDARQESQATPFHFASSQGTLSIVKLMYENHIEHNGHDKGRLILSAKDNAEMTPLHRAAMLDHVDVVKYLTEQGAEIDAIDRQKCTPLLLAAAKGATRSLVVLLEAGASIFLRDVNKRHVLHFSIIYNCRKEKETMSIVENICQTEDGRRLLNMKDSFGCTPLHVASKEGNLKFAEALIKLGAIVNLKDNDDQSPLHFAARYGRCNTVRRLLDSSAGATILNETDSMGMTALHVASMNGHTKVAQLLLEKGALIHRNFHGQTPLHLAVAHGYTQTMKILLSFHNTLLDQNCKKGNTALHYACEDNRAAAAELLLSAGCLYTKNNEEVTPMDVAIQRRNAEVATIMVQHDRWKELCSQGSTMYGCPLMGMIQHLPDVYKTVLDRCYIKADVDPNSREYWFQMKYDFEYMQLPPGKVREIMKHGDSTIENATPLHALNMMVRYGRVELLSHPVCLNFLQMKWRAYGVWFFLIHILFYSTFVACLTGSIIGAHRNISNAWDNKSNISIGADETGPRKLTMKPLSKELTLVYHLALLYLFIFCILNMLKELLQMYQQRVRYFLDYVNYIEWTMYLTAIIFVAPALLYGVAYDAQWQCGSVAVFLAWFNLLLYLQRLDSVGLYVVMFLQILSTVLRVIIVFSVLFIAFGLAFFILLSATPNGSFGTPLIAILQALMQLMGEYNYVDVYITPYLQLNGAQPLEYAPLNFMFLVVFVVLMPILFVNLLIGLAVGDIVMVQRDAQLKRLAMQVEYHTELEQKLPLWLIEKVDKTELTAYPRRSIKSGILSKVSERLNMHIMCANTSVVNAAEHRRQNPQFDLNNEAIMEELENVRRRMKETKTKTDNMHELLRLIVQKMEIVTETDPYDEGRRQSDEDEERTHAGRRRALRLRANVAPLIIRGKSTKE